MTFKDFADFITLHPDFSLLTLIIVSLVLVVLFFFVAVAVRGWPGEGEVYEDEDDGNEEPDEELEAEAQLPPEPTWKTLPRACPCLHTKPCHPRCTCVNGSSSVGCRRCCSYGSEEQQRTKAELLARKIDHEAEEHPDIPGPDN